jgi:hypothetical protein
MILSLRELLTRAEESLFLKGQFTQAIGEVINLNASTGDSECKV